MYVHEMNVIKNTDQDGNPEWQQLTSDDIVTLLDDKVTEELLASYFPGYGFYGPFVGTGEPKEIRISLGILRATIELHKILEGCDALIKMDDEDNERPLAQGITSVEERALRYLKDVKKALADYEMLSILPGKGYAPDTGESHVCLPCHILCAQIMLPLQYAKWVEQRVRIYKALGNVMRVVPSFYLNMSNKVSVKKRNDGSILRVDVYGTPRMSSMWDDWLEEYESILKDDVTVSALEMIAGLRHLADTLATIHLATDIPTVNQGCYARLGTEDSLTDLWRRVYDTRVGGDINVGLCTVCGRVYFGTHKAKQGHPSCMNKYRVMKSRAKKYFELTETGMEPAAASRKAGISQQTAINVLEMNKDIKEI